MSIVEYFRLIEAPPCHPAAEESEIAAAERRLGGRLPEGLRDWYRQADGFDGEAKGCMWRFWPLCDLCAVAEIFTHASEIKVIQDGHPNRLIDGSHYVVFCDALIYLPCYAVNIRPDSPHFSEVIHGWDNGKSVAETYFVARRFETFATHLFAHPDDCILEPEL